MLGTLLLNLIFLKTPVLILLTWPVGYKQVLKCKIDELRNDIKWITLKQAITLSNIFVISSIEQNLKMAEDL